MPHNVTTAFKQEKNKQDNQPLNLYTLHDYDGLGSNLRFAESKVDVTFNGLLYTAFPISMEAVTENSQGEVDAVRIQISNVNRVMEYYILLYDIQGKKVTIRQVWANKLSDSTNLIEYSYYIDKFTTNQETVSVECTSKFDLTEVELPFRKYMRGICGFTFKGIECTYVGAYTTCNHTIADCRLRNNMLRFGGCPSIPAQRTYVS
jgi:lambda family phage minor tail protein L